MKFLLLLTMICIVSGCGNYLKISTEELNSSSSSDTVNNQGVVSFLAGNISSANNMSGFDGTGAGANFSNPYGTAIDSTNTYLYVADSNNSTIRKIEIASGAVTTLAGAAGVNGSTDATGAAARFSNPSDIAIDSTDTYLYVTDSSNHTIRKIEIASGVVTTLAGTAGVYGSTDATGAGASFYVPIDVAVDKSGNLYVADLGNNTIRKIEIASGIVTTLAGTAGVRGSTDATGAAASFSAPAGIAIDSTDTSLYVVDLGNNTIRKIVIASVFVTTLAGTAGGAGSTDATGTDARFGNNPYGIAIDTTDTYLYVTDSSNYTIRKIQISSGVVTTLAGTAGVQGSIDATGAAARFYAPAGIAIDSTDTYLYVTEVNNNTIRKIEISPGVGVVSTLAGRGGNLVFANGIGADARFNMPIDVAVDKSGNLYVADLGNNIIRKIEIASGVVTTLAGTAGVYGSTDATGAAASFSAPAGIAIDSTDTYLYVADSNNSTIRKIEIASGIVTTLAGTAGFSWPMDGTGTDASFGEIQGIAIDSTDTYLYVVDGYSSIRKINISTKVVTTIPTFVPSLTDKLALDLLGNIYVTNYDSNTITKITPEGVQSIFVPSSEGLINPMGIKIDSDGNLFVADSGNNQIKKITSTGVVSTFVSLTASPAGIAIDSSGNLYITDIKTIISKIE
jgi:DNA-binding beta-propeller fold protein YncE